MRVNYAWAGALPELVETGADVLLGELRRFVPDAGPAQVDAWRSSMAVLREEGAQVLRLHPPARAHGTVLEYELPREAGRRPDVIVLQNGRVVVLEFKEAWLSRRADIDQVKAYARDLQGYHSECHDPEVLPLLVLCGAGARQRQVDGVHIVPAAGLGDALVALAQSGRGSAVDLEQWLKGEYAPLPTLVAAARLLFDRQELPFIRRAHSAGVPQTVERVLQLTEEAADGGQRLLVLLTGVPGAGKTLVGLQVAHSARLDGHVVARQYAGRRRRSGGAPSTFLSGNGPLVQVLQDALKDRTFVQDMHRFIRYHGLERPELPPDEHLIVFDEAQRAWSADKIDDFYSKKLDRRSVDLSRSEPDMLVEIADRAPGWSAVLALVGGGQEIHTGEEAGMAQWADAVLRSGQRVAWRIVGPPFLQRLFAERGLPYEIDDRLNLNATLRTHSAATYHRWVELVLDDRGRHLGEAAALAGQLRQAGFPIYVTRDLAAARGYLTQRFGGEPMRRYGLLASSKARNLEAYGVDPGFQATKRLKVHQWFNAEPDSELSCCQMRDVITEFQCQGLEVDLPIVCWGDDFYWEDGWTMRPGRLQRLVRDPFQLRTNAYRVLMTRGREGLVVWVPAEPAGAMDATAGALVRAGAVRVGAKDRKVA